MGLLDGKVALVTGVARGQGRAHALRMAEEGADIIGIDICAQIESVALPLATLADLEETRSLVKQRGRRAILEVVDVRDRRAVADLMQRAVKELGRLDIVIANAGVWGVGFETHGGYQSPMPSEDRERLFRDTFDVNVMGAWNTLQASVPHMIASGRGGAIVLTSSTAGLQALAIDDIAQEAYTTSKHAVVGLMRSAATNLAKHWIRVNTIHPTGVAGTMGENAVVASLFDGTHGLEGASTNALDVAAVEVDDICNAVIYLVSDLGRYVTGITLPVDAGFLLRQPPVPPPPAGSAHGNTP